MTRYLGLAEFFWLAGQVTGLDTRTLVEASRVELADSASNGAWRSHLTPGRRRERIPTFRFNL